MILFINILILNIQYSLLLLHFLHKILLLLIFLEMEVIVPIKNNKKIIMLIYQKCYF